MDQRHDMMVNDKVDVVLKSTLDLHKSASRQLFNYLRATRIEVGLLFHFGPNGVGHFRLVSSNQDATKKTRSVDVGHYVDGSTPIRTDRADLRR